MVPASVCLLLAGVDYTCNVVLGLSHSGSRSAFCSVGHPTDCFSLQLTGCCIILYRLLFYKSHHTMCAMNKRIEYNNYKQFECKTLISPGDNKKGVKLDMKGTELNRCKSIGRSWMKLLNRCKKYRNKSVQLTTTSIIISHIHASLQLCILAP